MIEKSHLHSFNSKSAFNTNMDKKNINVIDLGASPGGWSQVLSHILSNSKTEYLFLEHCLKWFDVIHFANNFSI